MYFIYYNASVFILLNKYAFKIWNRSTMISLAFQANQITFVIRTVDISQHTMNGETCPVRLPFLMYVKKLVSTNGLIMNTLKDCSCLKHEKPSLCKMI